MGKFAFLIFAATAVAGGMTLLFSGLYSLLGASWLLSAAITFGTTFYHFAMRLAVGVTIRRIPDPGALWFRPHHWEPRLYDILRVKQWKKHMPTFNPSQFSLKENTLPQILHNSCRAEVVHEVIMVLSFLPVLTIPRFGAAGVFWTTSILSALFDSSFVILQRFNRPRLQRILAREASRL